MKIRTHDERGLSESAQWAVLWPLVLLVTLGILQAGVFLHSRNVAQRAAIASVSAARGSFGSAADAERLGLGIAQAGGLRGIAVKVARSGPRVTATVSGNAPMIFDLRLGRIHEQASAPVERVTSP